MCVVYGNIISFLRPCGANCKITFIIMWLVATLGKGKVCEVSQLQCQPVHVVVEHEIQKPIIHIESNYAGSLVRTLAPIIILNTCCYVTIVVWTLSAHVNLLDEPGETEIRKICIISGLNTCNSEISDINWYIGLGIKLVN